MLNKYQIIARILLAEVIVLSCLTAVAYPHSALAHLSDGCRVDHIAVSEEHGNVSVSICEEQPDVRGEPHAGKYTGSEIILSGYNRIADLYIHELGHATGYDHRPGGVMDSAPVPSPDCSVSQIERSIADAWDTVSVDGGLCQHLETPYGGVY
jgi:hypothetical protein